MQVWTTVYRDRVRIPKGVCQLSLDANMNRSLTVVRSLLLQCMYITYLQ